MFVYLLKWVLDIAVPPTPQLEELYVPRDELGYVEWLLEKVGSIELHEPTFHDYGTNLTIYTSNFEDLFFHMDIAIRYLNPHIDEEDVVYPDVLQVISYVEYRLTVKRDYVDTRSLLDILAGKFKVFDERLSTLEESDKIYQTRRWARLISDITTLLETLLTRHHRNESEVTDTF